MSTKSVNKVILFGEIVKTPNIGITNTNRTVANLIVATNDSYISEGNKVDKFENHKIVAWGKLAEYCKNLKKGDEVYVEGRNQTRKVTNENGTVTYISEIVAKEIQ